MYSLALHVVECMFNFSFYVLTLLHLFCLFSISKLHYIITTQLKDSVQTDASIKTGPGRKGANHASGLQIM